MNTDKENFLINNSMTYTEIKSDLSNKMANPDNKENFVEYYNIFIKPETLEKLEIEGYKIKETIIYGSLLSHYTISV